MQVLKGSENLSDSLWGSVVTIGNFDGVHLGHRSLVEKTVSFARENRLHSVVMTFNPHPMKVLFPERELKRLFNFGDQESELDQMGVDFFVQQPFSRELSALSAEEFLNQVIVKPLNPKAIVVGYDFAFGANRTGTIPFLQSYCSKQGIELFVMSQIEVRGETISSTLLRKLVSVGDMKFVEECLGRAFYLEGVVEKGAGRGREIGFPTANVFTKAESFPKTGVYSSRTVLGSRSFPSITNVGKNPTFSEKTKRALQVETHILDFDEDIYGDSIRVEFLDYVRPEKRFSSVTDLIEQIKFDIIIAREFHDKMGIDK